MPNSYRMPYPTAGDVEGGQGVQQTGREPSQAAVAEPRFDVERLEGLERQAQGREHRSGHVLGAGVEQVLPELAAQHVLGGEVVHEAGVGLVVRGGGAGLSVDQTVTDGQCEGVIGVVQAGRLDRGAPAVVEVVEQILLEVLDRGARCA